MAQFRQSGISSGATSSGGVSDQHVAIGVRGGVSHKLPRHHHHHHRRWKSSGVRKISVVLIFFLLVAFFASVVAFFFLSDQHKEIIGHHNQEDDIGNDADFLTNVTRTEKPKVLKFGIGSVNHGRDSRYWDRDDRRRDDDYTEEDMEQSQEDSVNKDHVSLNVKNSDSSSSGTGSNNGVQHKKSILYNEAGRDELKRYEAEYEESLKSIGQSKDKKKMRADTDERNQNEMVDADDGYDDGIDFEDAQMDEERKAGHENEQQSESDILDDGESSLEFNRRNVEEANEDSNHSSVDEFSAGFHNPDKVQTKSGHVNFKRSVPDRRAGTKKKSKRHKYSGSCEMKILNSSALLIEPVESKKFARFSLQYTDKEEKPNELENWETRFAGHQSLEEREQSFIARDQKINCGFVKGSNRSTSGFDIAEDDEKYMSSCHIAVMSCIFGNSDRLRSPVNKMVSKTSKKNVCFVMFVDETTLQTLVAEGQILDGGFIGLWRVVVVKNLPYTDMRRVGKIPKFLSHRLFPSARYSIWLDSKLRLQLDPLLLLELFLWRKGFEYAISNHYDRHCVWEEVAQNKRLNKYNHTVIDEQFAFYQADGLKRFDPADPQNLLPSNVPEGSLIIRAHTPMSNLFSCLWFNEVERFTPRDQLSFAYTYFKLRRTNPEKPFYLKMFKDCERRKIAKLFRHRSEDKRTLPQHENE